jgi:hypothetical protein
MLVRLFDFSINATVLNYFLDVQLNPGGISALEQGPKAHQLCPSI